MKKRIIIITSLVVTVLIILGVVCGFMLYKTPNSTCDNSLTDSTLSKPITNSIEQYQLGLKYLNGDQVEQNYEEAVKWFKLSAEQNNINAEMMLYQLYQLYPNGEGIEIDEATAMKYLQDAATHGHKEAIIQLVYKYAEEGKTRQAQIYNLLKQSGDTELITKIGKMYATGDMFEKNADMAYKLLNIAINNNKNIDKETFDLIMLTGDLYIANIADDMNETDREEALNNILNLYTTTLNNKKYYSKGQETEIILKMDDIKTELADLYYNKASSIPEHATEWLIRASDYGHADASYKLGLFYETKVNIHGINWHSEFNINAETAIKYYKIAAKQNHIEAQFRLGYIYEDPDGNYYTIINKHDYNNAIFWYTKAASNGHIEAMYRLGNIYENQENFTKAVEYYRKAAERGDTNSQNHLEQLISKLDNSMDLRI